MKNENFSDGYLHSLLSKQNQRCALSGISLELSNAVIDRIDGTLGLIHKDLKNMKGSLNQSDFLEWCRRCFLHSYENMPRPSVHESFLMQAFDVAHRSEDIHTKHGAIIVENATNHAIGSGYNALFRNMPNGDDILQRPEKYFWMIHAEENAIMNCSKNPLSLVGGARMYVTGTPCNSCLQRVINFGIKTIYQAKRVGTTLEDDATRARQRRIIAESGIEIIEMDLDNVWIRRVFLGR